MRASDRSAIALACVAGLALSCGGSSFFADVPDDPRLGRRVATGSRLRQTDWATAWNPDGVYVAVAEAPGHSPDLDEEKEPRTRVFRVDPKDGGGVHELPTLSEASSVWLPTLTWPGVLVVNSTGLHHSGGGGWTHRPFPDFAPEGTQLLQANARSGDSLVVCDGHRVGIFRDGAWWTLELEMSRNDTVVLGPWDEAGLRLVFTVGGRLTTVLIDPESDEPSGPLTSLAWSPMKLGDTSIPGTTSEFQVVVQPTEEATPRLVRFGNGALSLGASAPTGTMLGGTNGARALIRASGATVSRAQVEDVWLVEGGTVKPGLGAFAAHLSCDCDRSLDSACACVDRDTLVELRPAPDASAVGLVFADDVDGRREFFFRRVEIPFQGNPLAAK